MRFTIYAGDEIIYDPYLASSGYAAISPTLTVELNKSGSLEFVLPPGSTGYDSITKLKTIIRVYRDDTLLFKGRVINDERDFYNRKRVYCEGALSFFIDSQMRPYHYNSSVASFLNTVIENHNSHVDNDKKFTVGTVSVTDPIGPRTRESSEYRSTLDVLNNELVEVFGGFLRVRESQGENVIDYIGEYGTTSSQTIEFGKNLLDLTEHISAEGIYTVLIPLGEEIKNNDGEVTGRLTIAEVNNNKDYLEDAAGVNLFGRIEAVSIWDEVSNPSLLKTLGQNLLANGIESSVKLTIKAIDYRMISQTEASFELGEMVRVISEPHNINTEFQVTKITYDISNPDQTTYEFGADYHTLTERTVSASKENKDMEGKITKSFNDVLNEAKDNATALINNGIGGHVYVKPDELYIMDTDSIDTATKVWRWNLGGLGYWHGQAGQASSGTYGLAITQDGAIVADYITTGKLNAGVIKTGLLQAFDNTDNWWNLSTGELHISGNAINIHSGDNISAYMDSISSTVNLLPSVYWTEANSNNPYESNGITWTLNPDGSVTAKGKTTSASSAYYFTDNVRNSETVPVLVIDPAKKYTLSGCPSGGGPSTYRLRAKVYTASPPEEPGSNTGTFKDEYGDGYTIDAGYKYVYLYAMVSSNTELPSEGITFYPMFEAGPVKHAYQSTHIGSGALQNRIKLAETSISQNAYQIELRAAALEKYTDDSIKELSFINLLPRIYWSENSVKDKSFVSGGITWSLNNDGSVTATGKATANSTYSFCGGKKSEPVPTIVTDQSKKYTISGCPSGGSESSYYLVARMYPLGVAPNNSANGTEVVDTGNGNTSGTGYTHAYVYAVIKKDTELPSGGITFYPMFESGSTRHAYQSTHDSSILIERIKYSETRITENASEIEARATTTEAQQYANRVEGQIGLRNILPSLYYTENNRDNPHTESGITWTTNSDGSITATGTASANSLFHISGGSFTDGDKQSAVYPISIDPDKEYMLSGCPSGGGENKYRLVAVAYRSGVTPNWYNNGTPYIDTGDGIKIDSGFVYVYVYAIVYKNKSLPSSGITFYPMLEAGDTKHAYQSTHLGSSALTSRLSQAEARLVIQSGLISAKVSLQEVENYTTDYVDDVISNYTTTRDMQSLINQTASSITSSVSETYIEKTESSVLNLVPVVYYTENNTENNPTTYSGITWTLNPDGSVTAKGTATANCSYSFSGGKKSAPVPVITTDHTKKYTISGCPSGGSENTYYLVARMYPLGVSPDDNTNGTQVIDIGQGNTSNTGYTHAYVYAFIKKDTELPSGGITFYPMFEVGSTKHAYQSSHLGGAIAQRVKSAESSITQTATAIESKVSTSDYNGNTIASMINQTATTVAINAAHINLEGKNINLTAGAGITITSDNFTVTKEGDVTAWSIHVKGTNAAPSDIAGWTVTSNTIKKLVTLSGSQYEIGLWAPTSPSASSQAFYVQNKTSNTYPFQVTYEGKLKATGVEVSGNITATSGSIAGSLVTSGINASNITVGTLSASRIDTNNLYIQGNNITNLLIGKVNEATASATSTDQYFRIGSWKAYASADNYITFSNLGATRFFSVYPNGDAGVFIDQAHSNLRNALIVTRGASKSDGHGGTTNGYALLTDGSVVATY